MHSKARDLFLKIDTIINKEAAREKSPATKDTSKAWQCALPTDLKSRVRVVVLASAEFGGDIRHELWEGYVADGDESGCSCRL